MSDLIPEALVGPLLAAAVSAMPQAPSKPVQIEITMSNEHPDAERVVKLARALATRQRTRSGLETQCLAKPGAPDEFLDELGKLGVDVAKIREELEKAKPTPFPISKITDCGHELVQIMRRFETKKVR